MNFWTSYNTEGDWDFMFVEAHNVGQDNWTTLPDLNGNTGTTTGESCPAGWHELHPFLDHYQTFTRAACTAPAARSLERSVRRLPRLAGLGDRPRRLRRSAGRGLHLLRERLGDAGTRRLHRRHDPARRLVDLLRGRRHGGWAVAGPPPGSAPNANNFLFTTAAGFPEGAMITTDDTLLLGFGFEAVTGADARAEVMGRAMDYLLRP